jgi:carboxypeptidase D
MIALLYMLVATASPVYSPAGPRLGAIHVVEINVSDAQTLDRIVSGGYDVSDVRSGKATIYATDAELEQLASDGYAIAEIPQVAEKAYHGYDSIVTTLEDAVETYPSICRMEKIGESALGRPLWAILVTDNPAMEEDEPELKYIGAVHGDEPLGVEMTLKFLNLLLTNYGVDERITSLVDNTAIWILPTMNPDGLESLERYNGNGYDLNRSFPSYPTNFTSTVFRGDLPDYSVWQPEVAAVMKWTINNSFVLSANFHTGDLVVNYPYDDDSIPSGVEAPSPDDDLFIDISKRYSIHNAPMWDSVDFKDGITNGNAWYRVLGGMQDWNYRYAGCNEVTIELSTTKKPAANTLSNFWSNNQESMLSYAESIQIGVRGIITDISTSKPMWAEARVMGIDHPVYTDPDVGDYHRMLLPGIYTMEFGAPGYFKKTVENVIVGEDAATRVDVSLATPDVNRDGVVDATDVQLMINTILGVETEYSCDIDGGGVSSTDVQLLVNTVLGVISVEE